MAKGKVTINEVICKGCGLCVSVCPKSVLALSTTKINPAGYNPAEMINEDCIACTSCAKMCPDCAIVDISLATPSLLSPKYLNIYLLNYPR